MMERRPKIHYSHLVKREKANNEIPIRMPQDDITFVHISIVNNIKYLKVQLDEYL